MTQESASTGFIHVAEWVFHLISPGANHEISGTFRDTVVSDLEGTA